jgi:hypothetical protein
MAAFSMLVAAAAAFSTTPLANRGAAVSPRRAVDTRMEASFDQWLETEAGVSAKFLPQVLSVCEEEMIGSVANLRTLADAGVLGTVFKPVIAAGIESALGGGAAAGGTAVATAAPATPESALSFSEVRWLGHSREHSCAVGVLSVRAHTRLSGAAAADAQRAGHVGLRGRAPVPAGDVHRHVAAQVCARDAPSARRQPRARDPAHAAA